MNISGTAMVLAAGRGVRMQPLTLETPKPLLKVGGKTMLDHALDKLVMQGIRRAIVNTFYLPEQIEAHCKTRTDIEIIISREAELLDTGGGIKNVLRQFGGEPFFALNADLPWTDGKVPSLRRMSTMWNPAKMDALLLMMPTAKARGFGPDGDFNLQAGGVLKRKNIAPPRSHVLISAQILKPDLFLRVKDKVFSNNVVWDMAETAGTLYGIEHDATCYHVGTPGDLQKANELLASGQGW